MNEAPPVILFDVDGTMLRDSVPAHYEAMLFAVDETLGHRFSYSYVEGVARFGERVVNGLTDSQVMSLLLEDLKWPDDQRQEATDDVFQRMGAKYSLLLKEGRSPGTVIAGVIEALDTLRSHEIDVGVVTGGIESVARDRLAATGLLPYFPFGAFGNEAADRTSLLHLAQSRIHNAFGSVGYIGDTTHDVFAAKGAGVYSFAVATGHCTVDELNAAGADTVFASLHADAALTIMKCLS